MRMGMESGSRLCARKWMKVFGTPAVCVQLKNPSVLRGVGCKVSACGAGAGAGAGAPQLAPPGFFRLGKSLPSVEDTGAYFVSHGRFCEVH